jgi:WD40 repeat protein
LRHREEQFALLRDNGVVEVWSPGEKADGPVTNFNHPFEIPPPKPDPVESTKPLTKKEQIAAKIKSPPPKPPPMIGLGAILSDKRRIVSASGDGVVCISQLDAGDVSQHMFKVGADMWAFDLSPTEHKRCAVGGREQLLRMWDLETSQCAWKARNLTNDWLDLKIPEWIRCIRHRPQHPSHIFTATAHHKLRLYDINAGRRPVLDFCPSERALLTLSVTPNPNYVIAGDSTGTMMLLDVRNGQQLGSYRGSGGALRDIVHHPDPSMPVVASVGLDRFLKIHHSITRRLIKRIYLKQKMNCILFSAETPTEEQDDEADVWGELERRTAGKPADSDIAKTIEQGEEEDDKQGEEEEDNEGDDNEGDGNEVDEQDMSSEDFFKQSTASVSFAGAVNNTSSKTTKRKR